VGYVNTAGYLDAASTEPLHPAAKSAWDEAVANAWADPARQYGAGRRARQTLDSAAEIVAGLVGCRADEITFTSSGTSAVHLGVAGLRLGRRRVGEHAVASAVEHSSVLSALGGTNGSPAPTLVPVDGTGRMDVRQFGEALRTRPDTALACVQSANHEVGTEQPLDEVIELCEAHDVPLLTDAAQSVGWAAPPQGWSVLAASAHKWGGPPGVGILAVRASARWRSPSPPDERASGRFPGFENVPGAAAAAAALAAVRADAATEASRLRGLTSRVRDRVAATVPDAVVVGHSEARLPHIVTFSCLYVPGEALVDELDRLGFAVSSGSSCSSSTLRPSHVLAAMGALTHGNIRVSLPRGVPAAVVDRFLAELPGAVARVRERLGTNSL
jgi:cysteine desulfurase